MNLYGLEIRNFRRLKHCWIDVAKETTVFVGPNNSGKTSAMEALIKFLGKPDDRKFLVTDFTISNWDELNKIGERWTAEENGDADDLDDPLSLKPWSAWLPSLDIWIEVSKTDIHRVVHLIPTLDWTTERMVGMRLTFAPKLEATQQRDDAESGSIRVSEVFYNDYRRAYLAARDALKSDSANLWPENLYDFLSKKGRLDAHFQVQAYLLDHTARFDEKRTRRLDFSPSPGTLRPLDGAPLKGLFQVDIVRAQRNLSNTDSRLFTEKLTKYHKSHLDPEDTPGPQDSEALEALGKAREDFSTLLGTQFGPAIKDLEKFGYPGFREPNIRLESQLGLGDGLNHPSTVRLALSQNKAHSLPAEYNGLGFQNLLMLTFDLMSFRDGWMRVGKADRPHQDPIAPIHIVLLEEPEAYLHVQVQQVFIDKAYGLLRGHESLKGEDSPFTSHLMISTHSSAISHQVDYASLRYFKKKAPEDSSAVPYAEVVSLSDVFGKNRKTTKFTRRYLRATHSDLFFADAVILVEGAAEQILLPFIIQNHHADLASRYVTLLNVGGSHAHTLRRLIERLDILTLIVTDLDAYKEAPKEVSKKKTAETQQGNKVRPVPGQNLVTSNPVLKTWLPGKKGLDEVLHAETEKESTKVAFPQSLTFKYKNISGKVIPYTFEDALYYENATVIDEIKASMCKKLTKAGSGDSVEKIAEALFLAINAGGFKKAELAIELLFEAKTPEEIRAPKYIQEGFVWLEEKLVGRETS